MKDQKSNISEIDKLIFALDKLEKFSKEENKKQKFEKIKQELVVKKSNTI